MFTRDPATERTRRPVFSLRLPNDLKAALEHRADLRSKSEQTRVTASQVARELIEAGLGMAPEAPPPESLIDEVMVSALFAKRALELVLSSHDGLAEKLLRAVRQEVSQRKQQVPPKTKRKMK